MAKIFHYPGIVFLLLAFVLSLLASISLPYLTVLDVARTKFENGGALDNSSVSITELRVSGMCLAPLFALLTPLSRVVGCLVRKVVFVEENGTLMSSLGPHARITFRMLGPALPVVRLFDRRSFQH